MLIKFSENFILLLISRWFWWSSSLSSSFRMLTAMRAPTGNMRSMSNCMITTTYISDVELRLYDDMYNSPQKMSSEGGPHRMEVPFTFDYCNFYQAQSKIASTILVLHNSIWVSDPVSDYRELQSEQVLQLMRTFLTWRENFDPIQDRTCLILNFGVKHLQYPTLRFYFFLLRDLVYFSFHLASLEMRTLEMIVWGKYFNFFLTFYMTSSERSWVSLTRPRRRLWWWEGSTWHS